MTQLSRLALAAGAALALVATAPAHAASNSFCTQYGAAALDQVHEAMSHRRCRERMQGDRWSTDGRVHFAWCKNVPKEATYAEQAARNHLLRECAGGDRDRHDHDRWDNDHGDRDQPDQGYRR